MVRPARQDRELPGRRLHGVCLAKRTYAGQYTSVSSQGMDEGPSAAQGGGRAPRRSGSAPATNWRWRCSTNAARVCRTPGSPGTTRWAVPRVSAGNCGAVANVTCWRSPRTRWSATWTFRPPEYSGRGRHPKNPFARLDRWCAALPEDGLDDDRGPGRRERPADDRGREVSGAARTETGGTGPEELLFVTRERQTGRHVQA